MVTAAENERMTRVGPGTPGGALLRSYWQPVALREELEGARPVRRVRLLGEDLVLFKAPDGRVGLTQRACPHRGADLSYGRLEDGGLRCPFHGWLFDAGGRCLETPAEPEASPLRNSIRARAYPVVERGGIHWAYLGEGEPPAFPAFDCFTAPDSHVFAFKGRIECNWLQALEVGIDPAHASFLHRFFEDEDTGAAYGKQFRNASADSDLPMTQVLRDYPRPEIKLERMPHGLRLMTLRHLANGRTHVRVTNGIFPQAFVIPLSSTMTISQWHVPVDDTSCYWFAMFTSFDAPVDKEAMRAQRLALYTLPDYIPRVGRHNDWGYSEAEQASATYTGMGFDINVHDQWAVESQGAIQDRTQENLGTSDRAIVMHRRMLLEAIAAVERGERARGAWTAEEAASLTGPETVDGIGPTEGWDRYWREADRRRRDAAPWTPRKAVA